MGLTDFIAWWADHWPLVPAIVAYCTWEAYKWKRAYILSVATTYTLLNRLKRRREP